MLLIGSALSYGYGWLQRADSANPSALPPAPSDRGNFNSSAIAPDSQFCGISGECHERGSGED
ncbi:MAG: hypothetical protein HC768_20440 [Acaryochloris sp. CRU_2_0]|nr:hypothetical protein [Acaryochloris sp. CRU_2_0]